MVRLPPATPGAVVVRFQDERASDVVAAGTCCHDGPPITDDSVFEAASLSKPVVALAVLKLVAMGSLDLDAPFLTPDDLADGQVDPEVASITPAMVLTHTTGLPNWRPFGEPLRFDSAPGTPGYSGEGFNLLLDALSRFVDMEAELDRVLGEFGAGSSSFVWREEFETSVVCGHWDSGEAIDKFRPPVARAHGTLHTTAADYSRFIEQSVFSEAARHSDWYEMAVTLRSDLSSVHTLMWALNPSDGGPILWQHGDNLGFKHVVAVRPEAGDGVLVLTNGDRGWELVREEATSLGLTLW